MSEERNMRGGGIPSPRRNQEEEQPKELSEVQQKALEGIHSHPDKDLLLAAKGKIDVRAEQAGYFANYRYKEGDKFTIPNKAQIGSWMRVI